MFTFHYLHPEKMFGCFEDGLFVAIFAIAAEASEYCDRHNRPEWTAKEILEREG